MDTTICLLRFGPALTMILFGLNQFINPENWIKYIPDSIVPYLPTTTENFMKMHALANIALGVLLLSGWQPIIVTSIVLAWWASIIPFAALVDWTIGVRDTAIGLSLAALIFLLKK
jgi:hypothetical protein